MRTPALQREMWRFLVHEAKREGFWADRGAAGNRPRIGARLAQIALRDPDARMQAEGLQ